MKLVICLTRLFVTISTAVTLSAALSANDSLADLPKKASERSQITSPGSRPFILKAKVLEATNPSNEGYKAEIEEYWVAPDKWRRSVKTSNFSQTLIVNGEKTSEQISGEYYPNWLRTIVAGIFEPDTALQGVDLSRSSDNPVLGGRQVCRRFTYMAGVAPVSNKVFSSFCFEDGLLESILEPGYSVSYKNYKKFAGKPVARTIGEYIESGTELEATIEELTELDAPDEVQFAIQQTKAPLQTLRIDEATLRLLAVNAPDIVWPTVRGGATQGTLSLYVCLDQSGHVREIYELNSSNAGLSDVARDQVMKWQFKPAQARGIPVQVEAILTFAFNTKIGNPIPILSDGEARNLATKIVEPAFPAGTASGTEVKVQVGVALDGSISGVSNPYNVPTPLFTAAYRAVREWHFRQYLRDGKPDVFGADIVFHVK